MRTMNTKSLLLIGITVSMAACGGSNVAPRDQALNGTKSFITKNLNALLTATTALQTSAPAGGANGWDPTADRAAIEAMKGHWKEARIAYESIEGAIAVLFPELDVSTDERYDGFLGNGPDDDLFDDQGVTGIHAIERILWSDAIPASVVDLRERARRLPAGALPADRRRGAGVQDQAVRAARRRRRTPCSRSSSRWRSIRRRPIAASSARWASRSRRPTRPPPAKRSRATPSTRSPTCAPTSPPASPPTTPSRRG